jgi:hypothetical protein
MKTHILLIIMTILVSACASYRGADQGQLEQQQRDHLTFLHGQGAIIR